ncbi:Mitogen-activated protein kinase kinase kinase [Sesamum alatum]|uniref:Mitogen-activated protein kinase kinase kinase n=1 Tax=Sesamum alatum TaxID=300844 RepID=A0AAE1XRB8_9LAMI|nr:Mitogen-activated protein kinase kinase kinase [Sesamum alatum]
MDWVRGEKLGQGSFATVSLAVPRGRSSCLPPLMAVKSCGVSHSSSLVNEKLVLEELKDCPEIIRCFGESFSCENGEKLYNVLLEYASGGSLADKLKKSGDRRLPESDVREYTKSLLKGLRYIHKVGFVHCDIKLQNILLGPNGGVKIADFGLAKRVGRKSGVPGCELRGTPMYMSPEMVSAGEQGAPADIWALGCLVAEMVTGAPAWSSSDVAGLLMRIGVGEEVPAIPGILSEEGKDFLGKCFVKNPSKRWTAEMLLNHPFVCDQEDLYGDSFAALKDRREITASTSPRCPFDFPDWVSVSSATCSITSLPSPAHFPESVLWFCEESNFRKESWSISPAQRLQELVSEQHGPHWFVSDDWVTIR